MAEEDVLLDLLLQWEDSWRGGRELSAEELCVNSPGLLQALKHRIEDARRVEAFLGGKKPEDTRQPLHRLPAARDGRYRIERFVAGGTSGEVYEAFDERLKRRVAVKLQRQIHGDEFLREARSVVQLDHPGIVRVYDVDRAEDRRVFIVMQWIDGGTLADHVQKKIAPTRVAQLLLQVADGVAYAHGANVVHRDLKPANILMDGRGTPRVADFGLALHDDSQRADTGQLVGTPAYMSPEQVMGKAIGCDGRTDVWALGVILYELLAKQRPFRGPTQEKLFEQILQARPTPLRKLVSHLPTELERICQRCLAAKPNERYPSAAELAAHLRRWLNRRRRILHRVQFAVVLLMIATAGLGTWTYQERAKRLAADVAFIARETEQGRQDFLTGEASQSLPHLRDAYALAQQTSGASPALRFLLARAAASIQRQIHTFALPGQFLSGVHVSPDGARLAAIGSDGRARVWEISSGRVIFCSPDSAAAPLAYVGFSPNGTRLLIVSGTDAAVWDVASGKEVFGCHGHELEIKWAAFSPDGRRIVTASADNTARIWSDTGTAPIILDGHARTVLFAEFNVQGDQVLTGSNDRTARLWNATNGKIIREFKGHKGGVGFGNVSPDALSVVTVGAPTTIVFPSASVINLWNVGKSEPLATFDTENHLVNRPVFSSDGARCVIIMAVGDGRTAEVRDLLTNKLLATLSGHNSRVVSAEVSPNGKLVVTGSFDKSIRLWDLETGTSLWRFDAPATQVAATASFTPDGARLSFSSGGEYKLIDLTGGALLADFRGETVAVVADQAIVHELGGKMASQSILDTKSRIVIAEASSATCGAVSADGKWFATASPETDTVTLWDAHDLSHRIVGSCPDGVGALALDGTGKRMLILSEKYNRFPDSRTYTLVDLNKSSTSSIIAKWETKDLPLALGFRQDDARALVAVGAGNKVNVHAISEVGGVFVCTLASVPQLPGAGAFSSDGSRLALPDSDGGAQVYDAKSGALLASVRGHSSLFVNAVAFSPDGQLLATGGSDRAVRVWDIATTKLLVAYTAHTAPVAHLIWTSDGRRLIASTTDYRTKVWDVHLETRDIQEVERIHN